MRKNIGDEMLNMRGIFPPVTTPFVNGEISFTHMAENIKKWNTFDLSGYVLLGSNGESVMLTENESVQLVETTMKYIPESRSVIIGTGRESLRATLEFTNRVHHIGAEAALVVPPHYFKSQMNSIALERFYLELAEHSSLPLIIYNVPKFVGFEIPQDTVIRLGKHPNIIGIKDSSGNITYLQNIIHSGIPDFQVLTGSANTLMAGLIMGATGAILAFANFAPGICIDIFRQVKNGNLDEARLLQLKIVRLNQLTTAMYGIGGLKFAMDQVGFFGGEPRMPLLPPDGHARTEIMVELKKLELIS
jgi:4-hydroxy-2-oxoglutarate aldolase